MTSKLAKIQLKKIYEIVENNFNLTPTGMISKLQLHKPQYLTTSCYGHFGRDFNSEKGTFSWESTSSKELFKENT